MAMVEQSKKDTMNAADFAEEFKTTPGRTPRIPEDTGDAVDEADEEC